jgi:sucrose-6-phosphate hydrolase SacC (GH32 family)
MRVLFLLGALAAVVEGADEPGRSSPLSDATHAWHLGDLRDSAGQHAALEIQGDGIEVGVALTGAEKEASLARGGDGRVAKFEGNGWLSSAATLSATPAMTFCVRVQPAKTGGLLWTSPFSLVLHESELAIGVAGVADAAGRRYSELPLSHLRMREWQDVVVRCEKGWLDFIVNGELLNRMPLTDAPQELLRGPILLGAWRIHEPAVPGFAPSAVKWLFERVFSGLIDHAGIWNRALSDKEIAQLCGTTAIKPMPAMSEAQQCLAAYREFETASRAGNVEECKRLGLAMRAFMARDPRRPTYHLTAPMDGILDPAGAYFYKGRYHVFSYRNMVSLLACTPLTHFVSDDLVHWRDLPIAIWADSSLDVQGIWLGNLFLDDERQPRMIYTALGERGKIGVLTRARDDLLSFTEKEAVMTGMVHHDGHTWKEGETWYSITTRQYWGKRDGDLGDAIHLLTSPDLHKWTDRGEIFSVRKHASPGDDNQRWGFTEFPYLVPFGDKYALIAGTRPARYWIGRFDKDKPAFIPDEAEGRLLDHLNPFHCFNPSIVDRKGPGGAERRIILAMNCYPSGKANGVPWYGVHVLPRVLTREGGRLLQEPVPEIEALRGDHHRQGPTAIPAGASGLVPGIKGDALELVAEFRPGTASRFGIKVRAGEKGQGGTRIFYDVATGQVAVEGGLRKLSPYAELGRTPAHVARGEPVRLRIFLDRSLLEVFVNGETLCGVFSSPPADVRVDLFSEGGDAELKSLEAWEMKSAWPASSQTR